jgi:hypothetical protein
MYCGRMEEDSGDDVLVAYHNLFLLCQDSDLRNSGEEGRCTAFGSPVVPLLKQSIAQTLLFFFPFGNLQGSICFLSPNFLLSSTKAFTLLALSTSSSRTKILLSSTPHFLAAALTTNDIFRVHSLNP